MEEEEVLVEGFERAETDLFDFINSLSEKGSSNNGEEQSEEQKESQKADHESADPLQIYFNSGEDISVLAREEEIELFKRIEEGKQIIWKTISIFPLTKKVQKSLKGNKEFSGKEKHKEEVIRIVLGKLRSFNGRPNPLAKKIKSDLEIKINQLELIWEMLEKTENLVKEAKNEVIVRNLRLVINVARGYQGRGLPLVDLVQEGIFGLMKAVDKFKYKKGFKFSTYAMWWIRQAIMRALCDQARIIRLPVYMMEFYYRVARVSRQLVQKLGREPMAGEIASKLKVPTKKVEDLFRAIKEPISLQVQVGDEDTELEKYISDENSLSPYAETEQKERVKYIQKVLGTLTPREEKVIKMRFGIGEDRDYTLEEVGERFRVTRERIRQIEVRALRKLKNPKRLKKLKAVL